MKTTTAKTLTTAEAKLAASVLRPLIDNGLLPTWLAESLKALAAGGGTAPRPVAMRQALTRQGVAELLQVSTKTIDNWTTEGRLRRVQVGKRAVRFNAEDVEALLAGNK